MNKHGQQTPEDGIHVPFAWIWVDTSARNSQAVTSEDINKIGLQQDTNTIYVLTDLSPTWDTVSSVGITDFGDFNVGIGGGTPYFDESVSSGLAIGNGGSILSSLQLAQSGPELSGGDRSQVSRYPIQSLTFFGDGGWRNVGDAIRIGDQKAINFHGRLVGTNTSVVFPPYSKALHAFKFEGVIISDESHASLVYFSTSKLYSDSAFVEASGFLTESGGLNYLAVSVRDASSPAASTYTHWGGLVEAVELGYTYVF